MFFKIILFVIGIYVVWYLCFRNFGASIVALGKIPKAIPYVYKDVVSYFKEKKWLQFKDTGIVLFGGLFGTGKTLGMVEYVNRIYHRYNNIIVVSNVSLKGIPYKPFQYFEQLTDPTPDGKIIVYVCDEFGSLFNSRNYKNNQITEVEYLNVLNQLRKDHKLLLISTQRYGMLDKCFRQVAKLWYECGHFWRFYWRYSYDPYDLEYSLDPRLVRPLSLFPKMTFATDKVYSLYDTHEIVKSFDNPIHITDRTDTSSNVSADYKYSRNSKKKYWSR